MLATFVVRRRLTLASGLVLATVFGMSFVRHRVRDLTLAPYFTTALLPVKSQTILLTLFVGLLAAGICALVWMARTFARGRGPSATEG
jgi:hypothetical protein